MKKLLIIILSFSLVGCTVEGYVVDAATKRCADNGGLYSILVEGNVRHAKCNDGTIELFVDKRIVNK
jgi:hypothetical protein